MDDMKDEISMLREILEQSGWSQEQLAGKLGVSFPTVNSWLNDKSKPREGVKKRIRELYLAREIGYRNEPVLITINCMSLDLAVGDYVILEKAPNNHYDDEAIAVWLEEETILDEDSVGGIAYVANSTSTVARGTWSAGRIYDKIGKFGRAKVLFVLKGSAIAEIIDWEAEGWESN